MNKKITILTIGIGILFIGFLVIYMNKSISENESMAGMPGMSESKENGSGEVHNISSSDLEKDINNPGVIIVDIREPNLYHESHIPSSINIPFEEFQDRYQELDPKKNIILVCHTGPMGEASGQLLLQHGYQHVSNLSGGIAQWSGQVEN